MKIIKRLPWGHIGYWAAAVVIAVMGGTLYKAFVDKKNSAARVASTLEVLNGIGGINESLARAESAQRGFLLSADKAFIGQRDEALILMGHHIEGVSRLTADNAHQQGKIAQLDRLIEERIKIMRTNEETRIARGVTAVAEIVSGGVGTVASTRIYDLTSELKREALRLLESGRLGEQRGYELEVAVLLAAFLVAVSVMVPGYIGFIVAARARRRAESQLYDLTENLPGAVFQYRTNPYGTSRYEYLSGGTEKLHGVKRNAALENPQLLFDSLVPEDREAFLGAVAKAERELSHIEIDFRVRKPEGEIRWLRSWATPRRERDGTILWNGHWRDVTDKKEMEGALLAAKEQADSANRAKSAFLATMSHEIRTPINGMFGMLDVLALTELSPDQRTSLEIVHESGKSLLRIIDDILDFSKIEAGKLELHPEPVSIAALVERLRNIYSGNASSKGLLLKVSVDPAVSPALMGDELRLRQILANLVSNAIKFTSRGRVELRVVRLETRATAEILQFSVVDTGMGISTEAQKTLFQPFSQAGRDISTRFGGTGLGLSICQRLASLMGGTIGVSSEEGNGTAITLTLPFPIADPAALELAREAAVGGGRESLGPRRAAPSAESAAMEGTLVLVVDDHPINRMVLVRQLNALGYATEVAEDGIEALGKWRHGRFGLVVTDCNMPEMDGYGLVSAIREIEAAEGRGRTPVMAYTANALQGEAENCLAAGMDDYVAKPVEFGVLARKLEQWVPIPGLRSPLDAAMLAEISGGDVELGRKFLARFSEFNREDTVRLLEAIAQRDFASMRRIAHRMKGSSRTVGANTLGDACELIERAARSGDWARVQARVPALNAEIARLDAYLVQT